MYHAQKLCIEQALKFLPKLKAGLAAATAADESDDDDVPPPPVF
jgi:hypothetical protein